MKFEIRYKTEKSQPHPFTFFVEGTNESSALTQGFAHLKTQGINYMKHSLSAHLVNETELMKQTTQNKPSGLEEFSLTQLLILECEFEIILLTHKRQQLQAFPISANLIELNENLELIKGEIERRRINGN